MQLRAGGLGHISVRVGEFKSIERSTFASQKKKKKKKGLFLNRGEPKKRGIVSRKASKPRRMATDEVREGGEAGGCWCTLPRSLSYQRYHHSRKIMV